MISLDEEITVIDNTRSPGAQLRHQREKHGLTVDQVAVHLKLRAFVVSALEADEYHVVPRLVFARGYLRAYAKVVGLSPDDIVQAFENLNLTDVRSDVISPLKNSFKKPPKRENTPLLPWLMLGIVVVLFIVVGIWNPFKHENISQSDAKVIEHTKQVTVSSKVPKQDSLEEIATPEEITTDTQNIPLSTLPELADTVNKKGS